MKSDTRLRILEAAEQTFARSGWLGATTQEIARGAKVNEVTLFRHFGNKNQLFVAVIERFIAERQQVVDEAVAEHAPLEEVLARYAEVQHRSLLKSAGFIRTLMAECGRHPKETSAAIQGVVKPLRNQLLRLLKAAQKRGEIRAGVDCEAALDLFSGMFFTQAVKPRTGKVGYTPDKYRALAVAVFVRGIRP